MMNRAVLIGACVLLAGCAGGGQDDLEAWMGEQAKTMRGAVRPVEHWPGRMAERSPVPKRISG